uniref:transposase n=1 Tax=Xenorhabdus lircayensis TaxID=2763499 RepID=UPI001E2B00AB|nr:transposase [Xenorhabdus lircayensis]
MTSGNTNDRHLVNALVKGLTRCLYGDKGYLSQSLCNELKAEGISLFLYEVEIPSQSLANVFTCELLRIINKSKNVLSDVWLEKAKSKP